MKGMLTRIDLAKRWGVSGSTIDKYRDQGYISLNKLGFYSLTSIEAIEYDGTDNLIMKKDRRIKELEQEILRYRNKFEEIKGVIGL